MSVTWMVNGLVVDTYKDGGHVTVSDEAMLMFSPVATSDTGRYTCSLSAPHTAYIKLLGPVESAEKKITVQSIEPTSLLHIIYYGTSLFLPPVPQPVVAITLSHTAPLYAGTSLTLTCTVTLDPNVNNNERVVTEWKGPRQIGDRYSVTPAKKESDSSYNGSLVIRLLTVQDGGMYSCIARVSGGNNVEAVTATDSVFITVMSTALAITLRNKFTEYL